MTSAVKKIFSVGAVKPSWIIQYATFFLMQT